MDMSKQSYAKLAESKSPKSNIVKDTAIAFVSGGIICVIGQAITQLYTMIFDEENSAIATSITLILIGGLLTGLGVYKNLARFCGGGTLIPITGFANSIVAAATEFKSEGQILGTSVKMFTIAGPVLVFGISSAIVYGLILCILQAI